MSDTITKNEISLMIEVTNKQSANLERIANNMRDMMDDHKIIRARLEDNRIYYPKEISQACEIKTAGLKEELKKLNSSMIEIFDIIKMRSLIIKGLFGLLGGIVTGIVAIAIHLIDFKF